MNRRTFIFNSFLGLAAIPAIKFPAVASQKKPEKQISLLGFFIAGYQYYEGEKTEHLLAAGSPLRLQREPGNTYDKNAVALYFNTHKLGFVPRASNEIVANLLDQNIPLTAKIAEVNREEGAWERVKVEVGMGKIYLK